MFPRQADALFNPPDYGAAERELTKKRMRANFRNALFLSRVFRVFRGKKRFICPQTLKRRENFKDEDHCSCPHGRRINSPFLLVSFRVSWAEDAMERQIRYQPRRRSCAKADQIVLLRLQRYNALTSMKTPLRTPSHKATANGSARPDLPQRNSETCEQRKQRRRRSASSGSLL